MVVAPFPISERRPLLYEHLLRVVADLNNLHIRCEIWVNGSLLTEKPEPSDLDVSVILDHDVSVELNGVQMDLFNRLSEGYGPDIDSFAYARRLREDPLFGNPMIDTAYDWGEQYGSESSDDWLKGFAVILLGETDVGLRIRRR